MMGEGAPPEDAVVATARRSGPVRLDEPEQAGMRWLNLGNRLWVESPLDPTIRVFTPLDPDGAENEEAQAIDLRLDPVSLKLSARGVPEERWIDLPDVEVFLDTLLSKLAEMLFMAYSDASQALLSADIDIGRPPQLVWPSDSLISVPLSEQRRVTRSRLEGLRAAMTAEVEVIDPEDSDDAVLLKRLSEIMARQALPADLTMWVAPCSSENKSHGSELMLRARMSGTFDLLAAPVCLARDATGLVVVPAVPGTVPELLNLFALRICLLLARAVEASSRRPLRRLTLKLFLVDQRSCVMASLSVEEQGWGYPLVMAARGLRGNDLPDMPFPISFFTEQLKATET